MAWQILISTRPDPPVFLVIGGPNGSGKSSVYRDSFYRLEQISFWIINPDLLAARISASENLDLRAANLQAVMRIEDWLESSIRTYQTVGVETVLSTAKYCRLVTLAKSLGFKFWFFYVLLDDPQRNVERVRVRVEKGGHAVPEDRIVDRYAKSLAQMPWFLNEADRAWIFDNSGASPRLVGEKIGGTVGLVPSAPQVLVEALTVRD